MRMIDIKDKNVYLIYRYHNQQLYFRGPGIFAEVYSCFSSASCRVEGPQFFEPIVQSRSLPRLPACLPSSSF